MTPKLTMFDTDIRDIDQAALRLAAAHEAALCTLVGLEGSFSRRLGAQFAISSDGRLSAGSLSDGCLEAELAAQASLARVQGAPRLLRYGAGSPFVDFRLPCGAGIDVLVDPLPDRAALAALVAALDARAPAELKLPLGRNGLLACRAYMPSPRLILLGAGAEMAELGQLANAYGLEAIAQGPHAGLTLGQAPTGLSVDPWTAILLLFHDHDWEGPILNWALETPAFYIGAIGGQKTRAARKAMLHQAGFAAQDVARVRSPMGLIPQARDPRTLALSVLADLVQAYEAGRPDPVLWG